MNEIIQIKQIKDIKENVKVLLEEFPHLRDDDMKLIATIWMRESGGQSISKNLSAWDFLKSLSEGKYTNSESIRRCRCKVQEENEHLRGKKYNQRQSDSQNFAKQINQ